MKTEMKDAVEGVANAKADVEVRVLRRIEVGSAIQQGDVYLHRVPAKHPRGKVMTSMQVAEGTTIGARHVVAGDVEVYAGAQLPDGVTAPADVDDAMLCGPVVVCHGKLLLTHPEHAHHELPKGTYQVTYQFDPRTMRRVVD